MGGSQQAGEEGHLGSGQLRVRFHFCLQTPSPDSSTGSLYSSTSESVSKESDILAPCGEFPQEVAWKLLPGPREGVGGGIFMSLSPSPACPTSFGCLPTRSGDTASVGSQEIWARNSL